MKKQERDSKITKEIVSFIRDNKITEFSELVDVLMDGGDDMAGWFRFVVGHPSFFLGLMDS